ncbi:Uncharacterised protein [Mycobacteroides abscessus subsp. massiliense]|nr:Uncharacterised protein [Mycobacteroides abscessus subsp. massiliense]
MLASVDRHSFPDIFIDLDTSARHRLIVVHEVARQLEPVPLDGLDTFFLGVGIDGLLLAVGGQHLVLVAVGIGRGEIPAQRAADVEILDLVAWGVPVDPDHPVLGLAVLIACENDSHGCFLSQLPR